MTTTTETKASIPNEATVPTKKPNKGVLRRLWGGVGAFMTFVAVIVGTLAVVVAVASHFSPPGQYTVFGHPVMSVLSGSMSPAIKTGDLVYDDPLTKAQAGNLHAGQVISFRQGREVFTHRIHAVKDANGGVAYQTKGDQNNAPDQPLVSPAQIVGLYRFKVPFGGYILNGLHKPFTLILLLASPLLWLLSGWLFQLARESEKRDQVPALAGEEVAVM